METYDIKLNGEIVAKDLKVKKYDFKNLDSEKDYKGIIIAKKEDKMVDSDEFSFKTAKYIPVTSVNFPFRAINVLPNRKTRITVQIFPQNASDKTLEFKTDKGKIEDGYITLENVGDVAKVQVKSKDTDFGGGTLGTLTVTCVEKEIELESVRMNPTPADVFIGDTQTLFVEYTPKDTTQRAITVTSSNPKSLGVELMDGSWRMIGKTVGKAKLTIESHYSDKIKSESREIEVKEKSVEPDPEPEVTE